jgi:hypothetical protein
MADIHDIANAVLTPTPQPAPTPIPTSPNAPLPSELHRIYNASQLSPDWNVMRAPSVSFVGSTGAATGGLGPEGWDQYAESARHVDEILKQYGRGGMSIGGLAKFFFEPFKQDVLGQIGAGASAGTPMFMVHGDPFNHNIRELSPPPGVSPLDTNRLFWRERAL